MNNQKVEAVEKNHHESENYTNTKDVSILIRTKNEGKYIGRTLDVLYSQTLKNFEILVVDSGSTDNTLEVAEKYPLKIYKISPESFTWGYALNYGFHRASGKYVICLSAHALPASEKWLDKLIANFSDEAVAAVASNMLPFPDCNPFDRRGLFRKYSIEKQKLAEGPPFIFSNSCSAIRKSVWNRVHFDESLLAVEEEDWARKARNLGYTVVYEPEAKVYHSHNESLRQIYKRHYELSHAFLLLGLQKFSFAKISYDFFAGSVYDMAYVLIKLDSIKWLFFAPMRRFVINFARLNAARNLRYS